MDISVEKKKFESLLDAVTTASTAEELELSYLGRNGLINTLLKGMKDLAPEKRKNAGQDINIFKQEVTKLVKEKKDALHQKEEQNISIDVTLPPKDISHGTLHPITLAVEEITSIFNKIGFIRMSYPEVDWEH